MEMYGEGQGINGPIWSQIALDSRSWANPYRPADRTWVGGTTASHPVTNADRLQWILDVELVGGGWNLLNARPGLSPNVPAETSMTAMALQALAPHRDFPGVEAAIQRGLDALSHSQLPNGGWSGWGTAGTDVESPVQVIVALTALGIDPVHDPRFVMPGGNPVTATLSMFDPVTGGFIRPADGGEGTGGVNFMSTDQGAYGLAAYVRFVQGDRSLYDMRDASSDFLTPHVIPGGGQSGFLTGDINGDGVVDDLDLMALRLYLLGIDDNVVNLGALDVNGDGTVDDRDVIALRLILLGL